MYEHSLGRVLPRGGGSRDAGAGGCGGEGAAGGGGEEGGGAAGHGGQRRAQEGKEGHHHRIVNKQRRGCRGTVSNVPQGNGKCLVATFRKNIRSETEIQIKNFRQQ